VAVTATPGFAFTGTVATVTDALVADTTTALSALIQWGDGASNPGTITGSAGSFTVSGSHTYTTAGTKTITVKISDAATSASAQATDSATVSCPSGEGVCSGACYSTGSDVNHCGATCLSCGSPANTSVSCNGACQYTCTTNYGACGGSPSSGCNTNLLTDANNCGRCNHSCGGAGATCSGGKCTATTILSGYNLYDVASSPEIIGLAADSTNVYWSYVDQSSPSFAGVWQATGTGAIIVKLDPYNGGYGLSLQGSTVGYIGVPGYHDPNTGAFCTATVGKFSSGSCSSFGQFPSFLTGSAAPGVTGTFYVLATEGYYTSTYGLYSCNAPASGQDGGTPCTALSLPCGSTCTGGVNLAYASPSESLFWIDATSGVNIDYYDVQHKQASSASAASGSGTSALATDGTNVYWIDNANAILRIPAQPANQSAHLTTVASSLAILDYAETLATDGTNVYFGATGPNQNGVYYVPVAGGTPTLLAVSTAPSTAGVVPTSIATGGGFVYWSESTPPVIRRVAAP
jgi:hypothetical protein